MACWGWVVRREVGSVWGRAVVTCCCGLGVRFGNCEDFLLVSISFVILRVVSVESMFECD